MIKKKLANGIEIFLKEDHFTNSVCIQCWVGAGSAHEQENERGISHVIEHMLFKGTQKLGIGEFAKIVEGCGGDVNAYTTFDRTVYYLNIVTAFAQNAVEMLADCLFHSTFDQAEFAREKEVILEEVRRGLDDPGARLAHEVFAQCYQGSEIGRPIIGSIESVTGFTREDLVRYHSKWYTPKNMRVVVVGNFETEEMLACIENTFGREKTRDFSPIVINRGKFAEGVNISLIKGDWEQPRLRVNFSGPELEEADAVLLDLAAFALGSGDTSRFSQRLRDSEAIVAAASAGVYAPSFGGLFTLSAAMEEEQIPAAISGLIRETVRMLTSDPITDEELEKARVNLKISRYHQEETLDGLAKTLGFGLTTKLGEYFEESYLSIVNKASPDDISQAIARWLSPDRLVVGCVLPEKSTLTEEVIRKAVIDGFKEGGWDEYTASQYKSSKINSTKTHSQLGGHKFAEVYTTPQGHQFIYRQHPDAKLFSLIALTEGGCRAETEKTSGLFNIYANLLGQETKSKDHLHYISAIENRGADLEGFSGKDSLGLRLTCMGEDWPYFTDLFFETLFTPVFPEEQWQTLKRQLYQAIKAEQDSPSNLCIREFQRKIFKQYPYARSILGTTEVINSFNLSELERSFAEYRDQGPWILTAVGSMPFAEVLSQIGPKLGDWKIPSGNRKLPTWERTQLGDVNQPPIFIAKDREQNHIMYGFPGMTWKDPKRPVLDVWSKIMGGQGGRLFMTLREAQSLAYSVSPIVGYGAQPWALGAYIACSPQKTKEALDGLRREILQTKEITCPLDEVTSAINYIVGNHELDMQKGSSQAMNMATMGLFGPGYDDLQTYIDHIKSVTPSQIKELMEELLDESKSITVVVGSSYED